MCHCRRRRPANRRRHRQDAVIAIAAGKTVGAEPAIHRVGAGISGEGVVAIETGHRIGAGAARCMVRKAAAGDDIIAAAADDQLEALKTGQARDARRGLARRDIDGEGQERKPEVECIEAIAARELEVRHAAELDLDEIVAEPAFGEDRDAEDVKCVASEPGEQGDVARAG